MERHIVVDVEEHEESIASSPMTPNSNTAGSTYGLVNYGHGTARKRDLLAGKTKQRLKMLGGLMAVVIVVGGSAMFIHSQYQSTEAFESHGITKGLEEGSVKSSVVYLQPKAYTATMTTLMPKITKQQVLNTSSSPTTKDPGEHGTVIFATEENRNSSLEKKDSDSHLDEDLAYQEGQKGESESSHPPYRNPKAICQQHIKLGPRKTDKNGKPLLQKDKLKNFADPISLLEQSLECPTFEYFQCKEWKDGNDKATNTGVKTLVYIRSIDSGLISYGVSKKSSKANAALIAASKLYGKPPNFNGKEAGIIRDLQDNANCTFPFV